MITLPTPPPPPAPPFLPEDVPFKIRAINWQFDQIFMDVRAEPTNCIYIDLSRFFVPSPQ